MPDLTFTSDLPVSAARAWSWATSIAGISAELKPLLRMTVPPGLVGFDTQHLVLGRPLFRSWILLFGFLPIDRSDLTIIEWDEGRRFLERSPMLSMRLWQHERVIEATGTASARLTDRLTFEPRFAGPFLSWFVKRIFQHRHGVLRRQVR